MPMLMVDETEVLAQDRGKWKKAVAALCQNRDEEDEVKKKN